MPTASRNVRKIRRIKRQRTIAFRLASLFESQRDEARMIASALEKELKKHETKITKPNLTITTVPENSTDTATGNIPQNE